MVDYFLLARFDVFTALKIQVEVFWIATPFSVVGCSTILRNVGILPQQNTLSQTRIFPYFVSNFVRKLTSCLLGKHLFLLYTFTAFNVVT
jgi:hypothetical protein